jgi:hypothetical protein
MDHSGSIHGSNYFIHHGKLAMEKVEGWMGIRRVPGTRLALKYCHGLPALVAFIIGGLIVLGMWQFIYRGDVVSYGDPAKVYFKPAAATEGDAIELCFDDVVWKRICRSKLITYLMTANGRIEMETYNIRPPKEPSRVPPKCRKWVVPDLGDRAAGASVLSGYAESECSPLDYWRPIITPMPGAKITINKR